MRNFFDTESEQYISESELEKEYNELKANNETDTENFEDYLENCLTKNNGTLEKVSLSENEIKEIAKEIMAEGAKECTEDNAIFYYEELKKIAKKDFSLFDLHQIELELLRNDDAVADTFIYSDQLILDIIFYTDYVDKIQEI